MGDVVHHLIDGAHVVGGVGAHAADPVAVPVMRIAGDGPFQRLHRRQAAPVHQQMAERYGALRHARHAKIRQVLCHRVVDGQPALAFQYAQRQRGDALAHRRDAEDRVFIRRAAALAGPAEATRVDLTLRAQHAYGSAGQLFFVKEPLQLCFHGADIHIDRLFRIV